MSIQLASFNCPHFFNAIPTDTFVQHESYALSDSTPVLSLWRASEVHYLISSPCPAVA